MPSRRSCVPSILASLFVALSLQSSPAQAPPANEEAAVRQAVSTVMRRYMASKKPPGAIVGVSVHGRRYFFHYGKATDDGAEFTPDTLVEIGSNTKTFTTALFSLAVARGQMEEGESIQKHMPDGIKLEPLAQKATAIQLASFQSGMPDDPTNLPPKLEMRSIEHYTTKDFLMWVGTLEASGAAARTVQVFQFRHRASRVPGNECDRQDLGAATQRRDRYATRHGRYRIATRSENSAAPRARTPDERQGRARMAHLCLVRSGWIALDSARYAPLRRGKLGTLRRRRQTRTASADRRHAESADTDLSAARPCEGASGDGLGRNRCRSRNRNGVTGVERRGHRRVFQRSSAASRQRHRCVRGD